MDKNPYSLIMEPVLTEKSNDLREEKEGTKRIHYVFKVRRDANKSEIIKAVNLIYGVKPLACRVITMKPKKKNARMRTPGYTSTWKKAIVTVSADKPIELFS